MTTITHRELLGLMGSTEMECAVARMANLAQERGTSFAALRVRADDFLDDGFDRDGFVDLIDYGWLEQEGDAYLATAQLWDRVRRRLVR